MTSRVNRFTGTARAGRGVLLGTAVLLWPLAVTLSLVVADRRRSASWLFLFAIGMQALFHILLSIGSGHGADGARGWPTVTMLAGHLVAAAVTALLLAQGDRLLHAWLIFWGMLARGGVTPASVPEMRSPVRPAYVAPFVRDWVNGAAISRRGPPARCS